MVLDALTKGAFELLWVWECAWAWEWAAEEEEVWAVDGLRWVDWDDTGGRKEPPPMVLLPLPGPLPGPGPPTRATAGEASNDDDMAWLLSIPTP